MARARNIKHGLYLNEELAELSIYARYLFPCLWCLADKNGRMEYRPRKIKAEAYPYDDVDIPALLIELHEKKFISVYGNGTRAYIQVNNWDKHQNPHPKEKPSPVPPIDDVASIVASVEFNDEREKQFIFTAEPRPSHEKPHRTSDSLPSDIMIPDSSPSGKEEPEQMTRKEFESLYIQTFGKMMSGMLNHDCDECRKRYPPQKIREAFLIGAENNATSFQYVKSVLEGKVKRLAKAPPSEHDPFAAIMKGVK